jgi:septation ring formation regulator EzrA
MIMNDYSIDYLIETFGKHHQKFINDRLEMQKKIDRCEIQFSDWMKETFSLSLALQAICKEIKSINDQLSNLSKDNSKIRCKLKIDALKHILEPDVSEEK